MGITTLFLQLRTRSLLNTHVQVGTPRMDWVALPVLNRFSNPIYCFLSHIIEFKYYSLAEFSRFNRTPETFELQAEHRHQVQRYGKGVLMEFPEAEVRLFVIYCFGNPGYRVYEVPLQES